MLDTMGGRQASEDLLGELMSPPPAVLGITEADEVNLIGGTPLCPASCRTTRRPPGSGLIDVVGPKHGLTSSSGCRRSQLQT